ncbi:MAG: PD40 domain-containing protein [Bacteroidetes bacterium]|nr:PD40 domain-containing protein [Bacteroidota bacterium]
MQRTFLLTLAALLPWISRAQEARLLRFPAVNATDVVFSYAGDLYTVSRQGGVARRLTGHIGYEMFPRFSPDGKTLAFSAQYDGNTEVYTMPAQGGAPTRITWTATLGRDDVSDRMGPNNLTMTWHPDGKQVIYRSRGKSFNDFKGQLFAAPVDGKPSVQLPFSAGSWCSYEAGGQRMAHNRVFREFRTWKYYEGGMADDIWIFDLKTGQSRNITNHKAQDIMPMWHKDRIYFISDRDRTMNLFCYEVSSGQTRKVTSFTDYDIKFPSLGPDAIVFEQGGYVWLFDLATEKASKLSIEIREDFASGRNPVINATDYIGWFEPSYDGKRALFGARGDIWSVPATTGVSYNLTQSAGAHERSPIWSPKGDRIAYISDVTGENEIWTMKPDGTDKKQHTRGTRTYMYRLNFSPDGSKILWADKELRLQYVDLATNKLTQVDKAEAWEFGEYEWSPDSRWIAYVRPEWMTTSRIVTHEVSTGKNREVSNPWFSAGNPTWSADGKYLYYAANTSFNPIYSHTEWNTAYQDMEKLYLVCLKADTPNPFADKNDQVEAVKDTPATTPPADAGKNTKVQVAIDFEQIIARTVELPGLEAGSYYGLIGAEGKLYYSFGNSKKPTALYLYDLAEKSATELGTVQGYGIAGTQHLMVRKDNNYYIIPMPVAPLSLKKPMNLAGMQQPIDQAEEWKQIYTEAWRQMRDFFYDPNMHGVDWEAIRRKYAPLLAHVNHRKDLTYIMGEMIGELNVGHAYVGGGAQPSVPKINMGLLGADLSQHSSGYVRIDKIYPGATWSDTYRSPLAFPGSDIREGEYLIAINGQSVKDLTNYAQALAGKADVNVELRINGKPEEAGARTVMVRPLDSEADLRYYSWVQDNIRKVNEATNGEVGYIHIPDMGPEGLNEFVKHFYPQLNKKALIIDDRGNGGGNVSPMIIERLRREMDMVTFSRNTRPEPSPEQMMIGPKVLLIDQYSASDGDLFPYRFKFHKLGTVVGQRSWGGTVGIRGSLPLVDGGTLSKPEFSRYDITGKEWIIEGYGVDPHVEVIQDPHLEFKGQDLQLEKALELIKEQIKTQGTALPPMPDRFPDKSR